MAPLLDESMEIDLFQPPVLTHTKPVYNNPIDFSKQYSTLHPQGLMAKIFKSFPLLHCALCGTRLHLNVSLQAITL